MEVRHRVPGQVVADDTGEQHERRHGNHQPASARNHTLDRLKTVIDRIASDESGSENSPSDDWEYCFHRFGAFAQL